MFGHWATPISPLPRLTTPPSRPRSQSASPSPSHSTMLDSIELLLCKLARLKYPPGNAALGRESAGPRDGQTAAESLLPVQTLRSPLPNKPPRDARDAFPEVN